VGDKLNYVIVAIVVAVISVAATYYLAPGKAGENATEMENVKAGFIYVGPVADLGWTTAHDQARKIVDDKFDWLETVFIESVELDDTSAMIDRLINEENCDIVFTTSFDFMDPTFESAERHSDTTFFHCSGYKRADNMGT
jgi:simple sugar transport system substrate-binding protein